MKVLLFVEERGRVKFAGLCYPWRFDPVGRCRSVIILPSADCGGYSAASWSAHRMCEASRWWVVECENADQGRVLLLNEEWQASGLVHVGGNKLGRIEQHPNVKLPEGRILASGGKP